MHGIYCFIRSHLFARANIYSLGRIMKASLFLIVVFALGAASAFPRAPKPHNAVQQESLAPLKNGFSKDVNHQEANRDNAGVLELRSGLDNEGAPSKINEIGSMVEMKYLGDERAIVDSEGEFELNSAATAYPKPRGPMLEMGYLQEDGMGNLDSEEQVDETYD